MKAGADFGTSLVKVVWMKDGQYRLYSTADVPLEGIVRQMEDEGVRSINVAGIGFSERHYGLFNGFELKTNQGESIDNEIALQAEGARRLLGNEGLQVKAFLLVSVGTGTSYASVTEAGVVRFPIGNSLGGGFISGLGKVLGVRDYETMAINASLGTPLDLLVKDVLPEKAGSFEGELVIANFGKAASGGLSLNAYASIVSTVAVAIARDVVVLGMIPNFQVPSDVVFVGSTVSRTPALRDMLARYTQLIIGKKPQFPKDGEFALAIGAYHHS